MLGGDLISAVLVRSHKSDRAGIARTALFAAAMLAGGSAFASEPPMLAGGGLLAPGQYEVPCESTLIPADALALGSRPARRVEAGETGTMISVSTTIEGPLDRPRPRRRYYTSSASCIATLRDPGPYTVTVYKNVGHWAWLPHTEIRAITKRSMGSLSKTSSYSIHVMRGYDPAAHADPPSRDDPHPCDGTDVREGDDSEMAEALRNVLARVFAELGAHIGPEHVNVLVDGIPRFVIWLEQSSGQPLHTATCQSAAFDDGTIESFETAGRAIAGALRQWDDNTRVTMRTLDLATNAVLDTARADVEGMDGAATESAARQAAEQLELSF